MSFGLNQNKTADLRQQAETSPAESLARRLTPDAL